MAADWDPVVAGIKRSELDATLTHAFSIARKAGDPAARDANYSLSGDGPVNVTITGLNKAAAKALWEKHIEPKIKKHHPSADIKILDK